MTAPKPQVQLAIGSRFEDIELVQIVVEASLRQLALEDDTSHKIAMSVREAVANAIRHGNRQDPDKHVEVCLDVDPNEVVISVTDEGEGFDPSEIPDPLSPENLLKPNGRGILFMKNFMDEIDYRFEPEKGTVLTMRKRVEPLHRAANKEEEN